jgi:hypothetical protein
MPEFVLRNASGVPITRSEDWARPKKEFHWKEERSAMELARAWFRTGPLSVPSNWRRCRNPTA